VILGTSIFACSTRQRLTFLLDSLLLSGLQLRYQRFAPYKPARSAVEVARLPKDVGVEIECIAAVKSNL